MGVPKFYKWLSERYPLINQVANSDIKPEFDNLYLDMNGIIHNCTHSDSTEIGAHSKALSESQVLTNVFKYLEKLFSIVQPKKFLYMAIDGVAPRAKMNQQRQRRFRAAKDAREAQEESRRRGEDVDTNAIFDSNCITPGTEFMVSLSHHIRYFIRKKMKEDSAWQKIKVVFSGAEVPGEGEHKIMLYIRNMKMQPGYEPNMRHVLYGLDADLVMLSLVSHEPHFALLREEVVFGGANLPRKILKKQDEFQFLHISLLREYMDLEFGTILKSPDAATPLPFEYNIERIVDDWIILAFFVGNDFLPHLPTLDIGEGGLDTLFQIYREELPKMGGYIFTPKKTIDWTRLERITQRMGELEESIFADRQAQAIEFARKQRRKESRKPVIEINEDALFEGEQVEASPSPDPNVLASTLQDLELEEKKESIPETNYHTFDSQLKMLMHGKTPEANMKDADGNTIDYESLSFKSRYYREKFPEFFDAGRALLRESSGTTTRGLTPEENIRALVKNYAEGLQWVAQYYFEGCRSWKWFFAYRYAPLASDMTNIAELDLKLALGYPFRPMEQLLGVLPPASGKFLPAAYRALMDPRTSSIADFYPLDFSIDMNGKRSAWEGIALIPFIDESRLLKALLNISPSQLSATEQKRNQRYGDEYLFQYDANAKDTIPATNPAFPNIVECHSRESVWVVPSIPMTDDEKQERAVYEAKAREDAKIDPTILPVPSYYSGNFKNELCEGLIYPTQGYPSLTASMKQNQTTIDASLQKLNVNVFGMESRKDSLLLRLTHTVAHPVGPALAKQVLGQRVFVDWPYLKEALVVGLTDATHIWTTSGARQMNQNESKNHRDECDTQKTKLMQTKAVDAGEVTVLLNVQMFVGMKRAANGAIQRAFSETTTFVPLQLVCQSIPNPDPRYVELPPPSLNDAFPVGTQIVYIGPQHYGSLGSIVSHSADKKTVSVKISVQPNESNFGRTISTQSQLQFYPSYLVSKSLGINALVLSKICSSVFVQQERTDIGLKLKFSKQSLQVPEYARRVDAWNSNDKTKKNNNDSSSSSSSSSSQQGTQEGWEYSEKAVALLAAYKRRFPLLFEMMNAEPNTFKYDGTSLIQPTPADAKKDLANPVPEKTATDAIKEIENWLKTVGINDLLLIPCSSQLIAERGIKAIEQESTRLAALRDASPAQEVVIPNVPIFHLYRPDPVVPWSPTESDMPQLGDRVLSIRSDAGAPFGMRGTVVCTHVSRHVEVVFDREFMSGTHLNHKCSNLRGQALALTSIINLTTPKVLAPKTQATPAPANAQKTTSAKAASQPVPVKQQLQQPAQQQPQSRSPPKAVPQQQQQPQPVPVQQQQQPAPVATTASSDVDASSALKQMLQIGGQRPAPTPAATASVAASSSSSSVAAVAPPSGDVDPMQRTLDKARARKAKPVANPQDLLSSGPQPIHYGQPPMMMHPPPQMMMMQPPPPMMMHPNGQPMMMPMQPMQPMMQQYSPPQQPMPPQQQQQQQPQPPQ